MLRSRDALRAGLPALAVVLALIAGGCGGRTHQEAVPVRDYATTPSYDLFIQDLHQQGVSVQALGIKPVYGHWSSSEGVAAEGCQCAQTWATLYVEHRLRVDGRVVVVDEGVVPGATDELTPDLAGMTQAPGQGSLHRYRRDNLLVTTTATDTRLLAALQTVLGATVAE